MNHRLLLITDRDLDDIWKGNTTRIRNLIQTFSFMQYDIAVICANLSPNDELRIVCKEVITIEQSFFEKGCLENFSPAEYGQAAAAISCRFQPSIIIAEYAWMALCFDFIKFPCTKVIDTHDILHEHTQRHLNMGLTPWVACSWQKEKELLEKADIIIAIQQREEQRFRDLLPGKKVICIPHLGEIQQIHNIDLLKDPVIGFIGSSHPGNKGIVEFIHSCWPLVTQKIPKCKLMVAGLAGNWIKETGNIQTKSYFNNVAEFYHAVTIVICPVLMGTGLKIKFIEALLFGKAIVATSVATEGIPTTDDPPYLLANDWYLFSEKIIQLINDDSLRSKMQQTALGYAEKHFSFQAGIRMIEQNLQ
jgi:glycosyltransferase involved in cell wall biosynthesis